MDFMLSLLVIAVTFFATSLITAFAIHRLLLTITHRED